MISIYNLYEIYMLNIVTLACPVKMRSSGGLLDTGPDKSTRFGVHGRFDEIFGTGLALYVIDTSSYPCTLVSGMEATVWLTHIKYVDARFQDQ